MKTTRILVTTAAIMGVTFASLPAATLTVAGDTEIFGAGHSSPQAGGQLPPFVTFAPGAFSVLTFSSVTGSVTLNITTGNNPNDPDGTGAAPSDSNTTSLNGISGIHAPNAGYLVGVFLNGTEPSDPAPPILDFTLIGTNFTTLSPVLDQTFFIGDGLTGDGTGAQQQFVVPAGATRLFLGISDAQGFHGGPGAYDDNTGSFSATFNVPEPTTIALLALSLAGCVFLRSRKRRTA